MQFSGYIRRLLGRPRGGPVRALPPSRITNTNRYALNRANLFPENSLIKAAVGADFRRRHEISQLKSAAKLSKNGLISHRPYLI